MTDENKTFNRDGAEKDLNRIKEIFEQNGVPFDTSIDDFNEDGSYIGDNPNKIINNGERKGTLEDIGDLLIGEELGLEDAWWLVPFTWGYRGVKTARISGKSIGTWIRTQRDKPMQEIHRKIGERWLRQNRNNKGVISEDKYRVYLDPKTKTLKSTRGTPSLSGKSQSGKSSNVSVDFSNPVQIGQQVINEGKRKILTPKMLNDLGYILAGREGTRQWVYYGAPIAATAYGVWSDKKEEDEYQTLNPNKIDD